MYAYSQAQINQIAKWAEAIVNKLTKRTTEDDFDKIAYGLRPKMNEAGNAAYEEAIEIAYSDWQVLQAMWAED